MNVLLLSTLFQGIGEREFFLLHRKIYEWEIRRAVPCTVGLRRNLKVLLQCWSIDGSDLPWDVAKCVWGGRCGIRHLPSWKGGWTVAQAGGWAADLKWRFGLLIGGGRLGPRCCEGTDGVGNVEQLWSGKVWKHLKVKKLQCK